MDEAEQIRLELDGEMLESISLVHRRPYPEFPGQEAPAVMALLQVLETPEGRADSDSAVFMRPVDQQVTTR